MSRGGVYSRKDPKTGRHRAWQVRIPDPLRPGKYIPTTLPPGLSKADANAEYLRQLRESFDDSVGRSSAAERTTLGAWADVWFERRHRDPGTAEATVKKDEDRWRCHVSRLGHHPLSGLTAPLVQDWLASGRTGRLAPSTKGAVLQLLITLTHAARRDGLFGPAAMRQGDTWAPPFRGVKAPRVPEVPRKTVEHSEWATWCRRAYELAAGSDLEKAGKASVIAVLLGAGVRRGELQHLRWGETVAIGVKDDEPAVELVVDGRVAKTKKARYAVIKGDLGAVLHQYAALSRHALGLDPVPIYPLVEYPPVGLPLWPFWQDLRLRGRVIRRRGEAIADPLPDSLWTALRDELADRELRVHDLRGSYALKIYDETQDLNRTMEALGHTRQETTIRYLAKHSRVPQDRLAELAAVRGSGLDNVVDLKRARLTRGLEKRRVAAEAAGETVPKRRRGADPRGEPRSGGARHDTPVTAKAYADRLDAWMRHDGTTARQLGALLEARVGLRTASGYGQLIGRLRKGKRASDRHGDLQACGAVLAELFGAAELARVPVFSPSAALPPKRRRSPRRAKAIGRTGGERSVPSGGEVSVPGTDSSPPGWVDERARGGLPSVPSRMKRAAGGHARASPAPQKDATGHAATCPVADEKPKTRKKAER